MDQSSCQNAKIQLQTAFGSSGKLPRVSGKLPGGSGKLPEISGKPAGSSGKLPGVSGKLPGGSGKLPGGLGKLPGSSGKRPGVSGKLPGVSGKLPGVSGKLPGVSGKLPGVSGKLPGSSGKLPGVFGKLPGGSGKLPGGFGKLPGGSGKRPGCLAKFKHAAPDVLNTAWARLSEEFKNGCADLVSLQKKRSAQSKILSRKKITDERAERLERKLLEAQGEGRFNEMVPKLAALGLRIGHKPGEAINIVGNNFELQKPEWSCWHRDWFSQADHDQAACGLNEGYLCKIHPWLCPADATEKPLFPRCRICTDGFRSSDRKPSWYDYSPVDRRVAASETDRLAAYNADFDRQKVRKHLDHHGGARYNGFLAFDQSFWEALEVSRKRLGVSGKVLGGSGKLLVVFGKLLRVSGKPLGVFGKRLEGCFRGSLGSVWEALGSFWESLGSFWESLASFWNGFLAFDFDLYA
eukprot:s4726_g3.t1